jgi:hypothetical protein
MTREDFYMTTPAPTTPTLPPTASVTAKTVKRRKPKSATGGIPYASATSDMRAREEIKKLLRHFGCEEIGFADKYEQHEVLLYFKHRGRQVHLHASAKGWAQMFLKQNPWTYSRRATRQEWEQRALQQGLVASNSILRDWLKGQVTAVECGILSFEAVFLPFMLAHDGRPLIEHVADMLPKAEAEKVVALPGR